jgi:hypothetical protein
MGPSRITGYLRKTDIGLGWLGLLLAVLFIATPQGPHSLALGSHVTFRLHPETGQISHYAEWQQNSRSPRGWDIVKRFDLTGKEHFNKSTRQYVPTPHVQGPSIVGIVRSAERWEIPNES